MKIKSQKDFFAGLMYLVVGGAFAIGATEYSIGTGARMGPGYFPMILGVLLALIGSVIAFKATLNGPSDGDPVGKWAWRQVFFILAANFAFGILLVGVPALGIPGFGLIVAIYALVLIASYARKEANIKETLILATVLAIGSYAVFVWALSLQFPVWPSFIVG
ncbi:MAG TPA: tripartite tricarboxylate transporter TctB family protein [Comamonas sp.]|uniref:tripartite tricarboxylate transporter TctB family protein n=1 Tax=Comamonas halotolerans TaxID=3041496 RepID=UPI0024E0D0E7|nr:tripartite tricarboxylate transporter TctB family protein [Comamonas sp. NoAH]